MQRRMLRKTMLAFATFDSVAACRACATQDPGATQPPAAPLERGAVGQTAEAPSGEDGSHADSAKYEREAHLRALGDQLLVKVDRSAEGYTLTRTADVSKPARPERLTIDQAEELLGNWKLRGLGGG
jgi:hypothetical protein